VQRGHPRTRPQQDPADTVGEGADAARLADDDVAVAQGTGRLAQALALPDLGHHLLTLDPGSDPRESLEGFPAADAVNGEAGVALEVPQGLVGERSEDAVDPAGIEAEAPEHALKGGDVVAPQHAAAVIEQAVAETTPGFDQGVPGLRTAHAVDAQPPVSLEGPDGGIGPVAVPAELIGGDVEPQGDQPLLQVPDRVEAAALPQGQTIRTAYRNGWSSCSS
jgi:hypothetical protein